jgi:hypothetical protein
MNAVDQYEWWRSALVGNTQPLHESEPQCGYFKVRDRRGVNANLAPVKRPFVAASIWPEGNELRAEIAGNPRSIDAVWPWVAKYPIRYADYQYWHKTERWPETISPRKEEK